MMKRGAAEVPRSAATAAAPRRPAAPLLSVAAPCAIRSPALGSCCETALYADSAPRCKHRQNHGFSSAKNIEQAEVSRS